MLGFLALSIPALLRLLLRRGRPGDPVPRGDPPRDPRGISLALLLFVLYLVAVGVVVVLLGGKGAPSFGTALLVDGGAKVAALVPVLWIVRRRPAAGTPVPRGRAVAAGLISGLAFFPVMAGTGLLLQKVHEWTGTPVEAQHLVDEARTGPTQRFLLVAAFAILLAPVFEEWLFRGLLQPGLRCFARPWVAALATAALFALLHGQADALPVTFLLGLALADLRERTGGLTAPIAMHACYNTIQMVGIAAMRGG